MEGNAVISEDWSVVQSIAVDSLFGCCFTVKLIIAFEGSVLCNKSTVRGHLPFPISAISNDTGAAGHVREGSHSQPVLPLGKSPQSRGPDSICHNRICRTSPQEVDIPID
jgi:hypothetical protein